MPQRQWKLLADAEIERLTETELKSYLGWLEDYKKRLESKTSGEAAAASLDRKRYWQKEEVRHQEAAQRQIAEIRKSLDE
jgi:hypothetical protein